LLKPSALFLGMGFVVLVVGAPTESEARFNRQLEISKECGALPSGGAIARTSGPCKRQASRRDRVHAKLPTAVSAELYCHNSSTGITQIVETAPVFLTPVPQSAIEVPAAVPAGTPNRGFEVVPYQGLIRNLLTAQPPDG
jgi:hypothetical protein